MTARRACRRSALPTPSRTPPPGDACRSAAVSRTFLTAMEGDDVWEFPRELVALIFSHTTPQVVCRSFAVSHAFREVMKWDDVWEPLLPPDYREIVPRAATPVEYASKMDLYFLLCGSILIDGGRKSFALERPSGKKSFMLPARELAIAWGHAPAYWKWVSHPESRFSEVAELRKVCWLEIRGNIHCRDLSHGTHYVAYLVFKLAEDSRGLDISQVASLKVGAHTSEGVVVLQPMRIRRGGFPRNPSLMLPVDLHPTPPPDDVEQLGPPEVPRTRGDGWMEIKLGEFFNDKGDDGEVEMCLMEIRGGHWKYGLIVEGIEVRPRERQ